MRGIVAHWGHGPACEDDSAGFCNYVLEMRRGVEEEKFESNEVGI